MSINIEIPATQTVARVHNPGPDARFVLEHGQPIPSLQKNQVLVKLQVAGLCHSDLNRVYGQLPLVTEIVGHEGAGVVVKAGSDDFSHLLSKRVGLGWLSSACLECAVCKVDYVSCPKQVNLGKDRAGTFQEYVAVDARFVHPLPEGLPSEVAAPLVCAGITMYSAIAKTNLPKNGWLLLPGAGGGLGHLGVQVAKARGYRVIAVDTGDDKRDVCSRYGADYFLDFMKDDVPAEVRKLTGCGADAVICTAGSIAAYKQAGDCVRNAGTIICIGITPAHLPISPLDLVRRGLHVRGSSVGTKEEMQKLFELAVQGEIEPLIEVVPFSNVDATARRLEEGKVAGRIVMTI